MLNLIFNSNPLNKDLGLFIIRFSIGIIFAVLHGYGKITGGASKWLWLGNQMKHFGITFLPVMWGFAASFVEFFGGICLALGLGTRVAAFLLFIVMIVALMYHFKNGDTINVYEYPMVLLIIVSSLMISGGGIYSLDQYFNF